MMRNRELLLPAKDLETLKIAFHFGADAVYIGGKELGLRAFATNFTVPQIKEAVEFAHERGKKVYITVNVIAKNKDIERAREYFKELKDIGLDGFLIADFGMYRVLKSVIPNANIHISTQAGNSNYESFLFWYDLGVRKVVCERLVTLEEIKKIREAVPSDMQIEAFIHGAMCISYSGRCLLSATMTGRDANHGECTHPCRWKYHLVEEQRPGEYFEIDEDEGGTYIMNSKDLCMIDALDDVLEAGVDSLKIEGRMKSPLYIATMARTYRQAIDDYTKDKALYEANKKSYYETVCQTTHREYSHGFYYGDTGASGIIPDNSDYVVDYTYLGYVEDVKDGYILLHQKNKFSIGENIDIMNTEGDELDVSVIDIKTIDGEHREDAPHPKEALWVKLSKEASVLDVLRRRD